MGKYRISLLSGPFPYQEGDRLFTVKGFNEYGVLGHSSQGIREYKILVNVLTGDVK